MSTIIIAEAGVNHNGSVQKAKEMIDVAKDAGADYVKFQTFFAKNLVTSSAEKAEYQKKSTSASESQYEMIEKLELNKNDHFEIVEHCNRRDIQFLSTAFDHESIDFLSQLKIPFYKIPSGEITNLPYLRHIGLMGKPVVMSTGMSTLDEINEAINIFLNIGMDKDDISLLHCNSEYPTPISDVNLKAMLTMRDHFGVKVGYSDHTLGIEVSIAAVAIGAKIIEKHFTLDRNLAGPDHLASLEPNELCEMIAAIRNVEKTFGDGIKKPTKSEMKNIFISRKSIVAKKNINIGEKFSEENLTTKRPGTGISPMSWDSMMGKVSDKDYQKDDLIK